MSRLLLRTVRVEAIRSIIKSKTNNETIKTIVKERKKKHTQFVLERRYRELINSVHARNVFCQFVENNDSVRHELIIIYVLYNDRFIL